jgi:hypothetical protein
LLLRSGGDTQARLLEIYRGGGQRARAWFTDDDADEMSADASTLLLCAAGAKL